MKRIIMTREEMNEIKKAIESIKKTHDQIVKSGTESGAEQDGHHDEGHQLSKQRSSVTMQRASELQNLLNRAEIIEVEDQAEVVKIGNGVLIEIDNKKMAFIVAGYIYDIQPGELRVSSQSPIGKEILGKKEGDVCKIKSPSGIKSIKVIKILPPKKAKEIYKEL